MAELSIYDDKVTAVAKQQGGGGQLGDSGQPFLILESSVRSTLTLRTDPDNYSHCTGPC